VETRILASIDSWTFCNLIIHSKGPTAFRNEDLLNFHSRESCSQKQTATPKKE